MKMKGIMRAAILAAMVVGVSLGSVRVCSPADIYVDPNSGNDASPGTKARPVRSVGAALSRIPETVTTLITIHLAPGTYKTTGGHGIPSNTLVLRRTMSQVSESLRDVSVHFVGMSKMFEGHAAPGEVIFDWGSTPLVQVYSGSWYFENLQIGNRTYPGSQTGVHVLGTASLVHLRDVRVRTGSQSGAGIYAGRGGEVRLYGCIELNEDLHDKAKENSFCGIIADYDGAVRWWDAEGTLSMGNGTLSVGYFGIIELGCKTARITSWGRQSNCFALNNSGRIDVHGTTTILSAKHPENTLIGPEDDGHILAEGAKIILKTEPGSAGKVVLQKSSTLFGGPFVIEGPSGVSFYAMSGSTLVGATVGKVDTVAADTGSYVSLSCEKPPAKITEIRNGKVDIQ